MSNAFDPKLGALIALLARGRSVSRTKLNKLCFFADVAAMLAEQGPITDHGYVKLQYGPVPNGIDYARHCLISWELLEESSAIDGAYVSYLYRSSDKVNFNAVAEDRDSGLNDVKVDVIQRVREKLGKKTAGYLSEKSHQFEPWKSAQMGSPLDLNRAVEDPDFVRWIASEGILPEKAVAN